MGLDCAVTVLHSSSKLMGICSLFKRANRSYWMTFFPGNKMTLIEFKTLLQSQRLLKLRGLWWLNSEVVVVIVCADGDDKVDVHPSVWRRYPQVVCCWGGVGRDFSWSSEASSSVCVWQYWDLAPPPMSFIKCLNGRGLFSQWVTSLTCIIWEEEDLRRSLSVFVGVFHRSCVCVAAEGKTQLKVLAPGVSPELLRGSPSCTWGCWTTRGLLWRKV